MIYITNQLGRIPCSPALSPKLVLPPPTAHTALSLEYCPRLRQTYWTDVGFKQEWRFEKQESNVVVMATQVKTRMFLMISYLSCLSRSIVTLTLIISTSCSWWGMSSSSDWLSHSPHLTIRFLKQCLIDFGISEIVSY